MAVIFPLPSSGQIKFTNKELLNILNNLILAKAEKKKDKSIKEFRDIKRGYGIYYSVEKFSGA